MLIRIKGGASILSLLRHPGMTRWAAILTAVALATVTVAQELHAKLIDLSLEELVQVKVTTVSRRSQDRFTAPAAVHVISGEEIRKLGIKSIPEALRLAPGVQVSRIDSNKWAVGVRGFPNRLSRSVLAMMDGRSVYTSLFAGVYWEVQDTFLDDIDRIEVIRGPGGTQWGANAVNGVINVLTKNAKDTQGLLVHAGGGSEDQGFGALRYGGRIGEDIYFRVYGKAFNRDGGYVSSGPSYDDWHMGQAGFRADWDATPADSFKLQGDIYDGKSGQRATLSSLTPPFTRTEFRDADLSGSNVLGRWLHTFANSSELRLQTYFDHTFRREPTFQEQRDTFDLDAQYELQLPWHQDVLWGLGYRVSADQTGAASGIMIDPADRTTQIVTGFVDDEITLIDRTLTLTLGTKLEHNDYSGFEIQPSARLSWIPVDSHVIWGSASRAVRSPSRIEHDLAIFGRPSNVNPNDPTVCVGEDNLCEFPTLLRNSGFDSEKVTAFQLGYRVQPLENVLIDTTVFYHDYYDLLSIEPEQPFIETDPSSGSTRRVLPLVFHNGFDGATYGFEATVNWVINDRVKTQVSYSHLQVDVTKDSDKPGITPGVFDGDSPQNMFTAQATSRLWWDVELDGLFRYVDRLPHQRVDSYLSLDLRVARRFGEHFELAVVGQNLLEDHHREFAGGTEVERSVYGEIRSNW